MDFLIGTYPCVRKDALIQRIHKSGDTTGEIVEDQAILDKAVKSIRCQTMLVQQQGMVDKRIKYWETVEDKMKELERRAGVPTRGPTLPRRP